MAIAVVAICGLGISVMSVVHAAEGDPVPEPTSTASDSPTAGETVTPSETVTPTPTEEPITTWWNVRKRTFPDGRIYYVNRPFCHPMTASECVSFIAQERQAVIYLHSAMQAEDESTAANSLRWLRLQSPETIFAFAVSAGGARTFDGGVCCTTAPVDELAYLDAIIRDVDLLVGLDPGRIGLLGMSNGGMVAERGICERPDLFAAAGSLSGSFAGPCDAGVVTVRQWHGAWDNVVPLNGGTRTILNVQRSFKPAASLAQRMAAGSDFHLEVVPATGHGLPGAVLVAATRWLTATLAQ